MAIIVTNNVATNIHAVSPLLGVGAGVNVDATVGVTAAGAAVVTDVDVVSALIAGVLAVSTAAMLGAAVVTGALATEAGLVCGSAYAKALCPIANAQALAARILNNVFMLGLVESIGSMRRTCAML